MDSGWPLHSLENKHLAHEPKDFDLNVPQNEPLDHMNLGFDATTTNYGQSHSNSNSSQVPIIQNHYGSIDASYSQGTNTIPSSSVLIPGYYDCMNQCFIPSTAAAAPVPPLNNYPMIIGGSGDIPRLEPGSSLGPDHQWQVHNRLTPVRRCANCHTTETPMWRRGPGGPKSLCNACGIKDRKEREKRKAEESVMMSQNRRN